jgi:hypothetical protein
MGSLLDLAMSAEKTPESRPATKGMCPACAEGQPGQCDRRAPPNWESCWARAHPELLS